MSDELLITIITALVGGGGVAAILDFLRNSKKDKIASHNDLLDNYKKQLDEQIEENELLKQKNKAVEEQIDLLQAERQIVNSTYMQELMQFEQKLNTVTVLWEELERLKNKIKTIN